MRKDAILFGIAGVFFGVLVGWIMGAQQATGVAPAAAPQSPPAQSAAGSAQPSPPPFDESRAAQLKAMFFRQTFTRLLLRALRESAPVREIMTDLIAGRQPYRGLRRRLLATREFRLVFALLKG